MVHWGASEGLLLQLIILYKARSFVRATVRCMDLKLHAGIAHVSENPYSLERQLNLSQGGPLEGKGKMAYEFKI